MVRTGAPSLPLLSHTVSVRPDVRPDDAACAVVDVSTSRTSELMVVMMNATIVRYVNT